MSETESATEPAAEEVPPKPAGGRRRLLLMIAVPAALAAIGAGGWFSGVLPRLLEGRKDSASAAPAERIFVSSPELVANLNSDPRRPRYVKVRAQIEVSSQKDAAEVTTAMPRLQDLFLTYLREMRPEDLQGAAGTYRLRQELIARADVAVAPAKVRDVLFVEMLVQ